MSDRKKREIGGKGKIGGIQLIGFLLYELNRWKNEREGDTDG